MLDRLLTRGLTMTVVGLITLSAGAALVLLLGAWSAAIDGHWSGAAMRLFAATVVGVSAWWLCLHRDELAG